MRRSILITALLFISAGTRGICQTLSAGGGTMEMLVGNQTYTLLPVARGDTTVLPLVSTYEYGTPMTFTLSGQPGQSFQIFFSASNIVFCTGQIAVSFAADAIYWSQQNMRLDPAIPQWVTCDSAGAATLLLGITLGIPSLNGAYLSPTIRCQAVSAGTGDTLAASTTVEVRMLGDLPIPPTSQLLHLSKGFTYTLDPEGGDGLLSPRVNGGERGIVQSISLWGEGRDTIWLDWRLPTILSSDDDSGSIPCSFAAGAIRVRETGYRLDPHVTNMLVFGDRCTLTLDVGFSVSVPADAAGGYTGALLVSVVYNGNLKRTPVRLPAEGFSYLWATVEEGDVPARFELLQNYPNPFNPVTTIRYGLPQPEQVSLAVHDVLGRAVATIVDEYQYAGWHTARWQADDVPSGVYFIEFRTPTSTLVRKLLLVK